MPIRRTATEPNLILEWDFSDARRDESRACHRRRKDADLNVNDHHYTEMDRIYPCVPEQRKHERCCDQKGRRPDGLEVQRR
jgi:hypothetical protein